MVEWGRRQETYSIQWEKTMRFQPLKDGKISGIKSVNKRLKLSSTCQFCKCQRYSPCGCRGAVKERKEAETRLNHNANLEENAA
jgi:hypothetical protein